MAGATGAKPTNRKDFLFKIISYSMEFQNCSSNARVSAQSGNFLERNYFRPWSRKVQ